MSSAELSRLFEDGLATVDAWHAIRTLDEEFISRYGLSPNERELVKHKPTPDRLASLGVPPLLAMWGSFMCNPDYESSMSAGEYFTELPCRLESSDG